MEAYLEASGYFEVRSSLHDKKQMTCSVPVLAPDKQRTEIR